MPDDAGQLVTARWFYAVDVPKFSSVSERTDKPTRSDEPSKWAEFAEDDDRALEAAFRTRRPGQFVEVNEDRLFEVDIDARLLLPVYWDGPAYEVRRAIWFQQGDAGKWIPCSENLSGQLEAGHK